uniref:Uncharacterized protein n=1 Tax=Arundo donax TaxID=35708 RepID=A0A0A9F136_ARUDO
MLLNFCDLCCANLTTAFYYFESRNTKGIMLL